MAFQKVNSLYWLLFWKSIKTSAKKVFRKILWIKNGFPDSSIRNESTCNVIDPWFNSWVKKFPWSRDRLPTPVFLGFPGDSEGKRICLQCGRPGFIHWVGKIFRRREWLPIPVFLPGELHGQRNLVSYSPWGSKELDTTE